MGRVDDPYRLGLEVLDDTPWYIPGADNRRGTERSLGFCDPYGYESEVRVMGGLNDPARESYQWHCRNYAQGRYKMICANGHVGTVRLCYGHVWMIQHHHSRSKNGCCPRCVWPSEARSLNEEADDLMRRIADPQTWPDERRQLGSRLTVIQEKMTEMYQRGIITTGAPLRLEEVS